MFYAKDSRLQLRLVGRGIQPALRINETELDFGDLLPGQVVTKELQLANVSPFPVVVIGRLASEDVVRQAMGPPAGAITGRKPAVLSLSAVPAVTFTPASFTMAPKTEGAISLTFSPDRASREWSDYLHVKLSTEESEQTVKVVGRSWSQVVFVTGGEIQSPLISEDPLCGMLPKLAEPVANPVFVPVPRAEPAKGKLVKGAPEKSNSVERRHLNFNLSLRSGGGFDVRFVTLAMLKPECAEKGGAKGDFSFEASSTAMFQIENGKATIDPSCPKQVEIKFQPPDLSAVLAGLVYSATAVLTVKACGQVQRYDFELQAYVTD